MNRPIPRRPMLQFLRTTGSFYNDEDHIIFSSLLFLIISIKIKFRMYILKNTEYSLCSRPKTA